MISGIIFDYGGTIDSAGDHWSEVIYDQYRAYGLDIDYDTFAEAYVYGERYLAKNYVVTASDTFRDVMRRKLTLQMNHLAEKGVLSQIAATASAYPIADACYRHARTCIDDIRDDIEALAERYPLVLVSNFYGNIDSVLRDMNLRHLFRGIVESAVIGIRKPDPRIFAVGCTVLDLPADEVLVVGDSIDKDLLPASSLGCSTAYIAGRPWRAAKAIPEAARFTPTTIHALTAELVK